MFTQYGNMIAGGQRMMGGSPLGAGGLGGFGLFAVLGLLVLAAIVVAVLIWLIARKRPAASTGGTPAPGLAVQTGDAALAIARERLARGEIDPDQYTAIVAALGGQSAAAAPQG